MSVSINQPAADATSRLKAQCRSVSRRHARVRSPTVRHDGKSKRPFGDPILDVSKARIFHDLAIVGLYVLVRGSTDVAVL
jgi:hypothetical protein